MILSDILERNLRNRPDKEAIYCEPCSIRLSYKELDKRINSLCNMFLKEGIKKGERIAIISDNCHVHIELLMAAAKGGWIMVEVDHRLSTKEVEYIIDDSDTRLVIVERSLKDTKSSISKRFHDVKIISFPDDYEKIIVSCSSRNPETIVKEEDIITLLYTSGTTGRPKGVIHSHKNLIASVINLACTLNVSEDDRTLHTSPFSHIAPIWPFLLHSYYGGSNVIIRDMDPRHILGTIESEKITTWNTVPVLIGRIVDTEGISSYDVSSLRWITYGASPIAENVLKKALKYFDCILNQVYGSTEVYVILFLKAKEHKPEGTVQEKRRLRSCGKEMINTKTRVVNKDGAIVQPGEIGEIITYGDHVSNGYWRNEDRTKESMKNGWFYTGDLALLDDDGYVYITARRREMIVSGGENIAPREIENVLSEHEAVNEAVVVGLPHKVWGEAVTGFVILKTGVKTSEAQLIEFCRERLSGYKCPKKIIFTKKFPMTTSGKILKRNIKEKYWNVY